MHGTKLIHKLFTKKAKHAPHIYGAHICCGRDVRQRLFRRDGVDLDQRPHRECGDLVAYARGHSRGEEPGVNGIHRGKVADVLQQDGRLGHVAERIAGLFEDMAQVVSDCRVWASMPSAIFWVAPSMGSCPET